MGVVALGLSFSILTGCGLGGGNTKKAVATTSTTASKNKAAPASTASTSFATIPAPATTAPTTLAPGQTGAVATTLAPGGAIAQPGEKYIVKAGDVPSKIAQAMGVSVSALLDANGLTQTAIIKVGQQLVVPTGGLMPAGGTDPNGQPAGGATQATGIPTTTVAGQNAPGSSKYVIASGDSWYGIASKFGVNPDTLLAINKATTATVIHAGQTIIIPAKAATATTVKAPATTVKAAATTVKATTTVKK
jgi:N-acetylmuramoyl-L-alanine amidase